MSPKKIIAIISVFIVVCALSYIAFHYASHSTHEHNQAEQSESDVIYDKNNNGDEQDREEHIIELTPEEIEGIGLDTAVAGSGSVDIQISLPGEISVNQDRMAHVVPRVAGVVTGVRKKLGDKVRTGEVLAVIESRELADAKAMYLATVERYEMAKLAFEREENLWKEKISSEQDYLNRKQALTEAGIKMRAAEQKLHAIGFDENYLKKLPKESELLLTQFEVTAPFEGTVINKHIVLGELVGTETTVFVIADLSYVWVDLQIYPKDLKHVKAGQEVIVSADSEIPDASGIISYVGPVIGTESRTALARVILANESGVFRPGLFVTAKTTVSKTQAEVIVPKEAIQTLEGKKCVFVKDEHGFEPTFIEVGLANTTNVEILSGLTPGQEYVVKGAFELKAKIITSTLDSHAGHGH